MSDFIMTMSDSEDETLEKQATMDSDDDDEAFSMGKEKKMTKQSKKRKQRDEPEDDDDEDDFAFETDVDPVAKIAAPTSTNPFRSAPSYTSATAERIKDIVAMRKWQKQQEKEKRREAGEQVSSDDESNDELSADEDVDEDDEHDEDEMEEKKETKFNAKEKSKKEKQKQSTSTPIQPVIVSPITNAATTFDALKLSRPLLKALTTLNFTKPTPVQAHCIPIALTGKDLLANAVTGSGKTAAFMLPILERLLYRPQRVPLSRVLVLIPTRELAAQCHSMSKDLAQYTDIRVCLVVGGLSITVQETELRSRPDIIIATPGRLIDHLRNTQTVHLEDIEILVLDEADRLLELGFADELREIVRQCPRGRQTLLFSATMSETVEDLINLSLKDPVKVAIDPYQSIVDKLVQEFIRIRPSHESMRESIILSLCMRSFRTRTIIFAASKQIVHRLMIIFGLAGLKAAELHGNLTQGQRMEALDLFRDGKVDFLLCTDLAARGLDIHGVDTVINMSLPKELRQYVHRVGRTARAGRAGRAISLVGDGQRKLLKEIVARAKDVVNSRVVSHEIMEKYKNKIDEMEEDIANVLEKEKEEKYERVALMEANKARNLMIHETEIHSRPARTWFQTEAEKLASKQMGGLVAGERKTPQTDIRESMHDDEEEGGKRKKEKKDPLRGLSRAKKRRKLMQMEADKLISKQLRESRRDDIDINPAELRKSTVNSESMVKSLARQAKNKVKHEKTLGKDGPKEKKMSHKKDGEESIRSKPKARYGGKLEDEKIDKRYTESKKTYKSAGKKKKGGDEDGGSKKKKKGTSKSRQRKRH